MREITGYPNDTRIGKFVLQDGLHYGYGITGKRICLGSRMGRRNTLPDNPEAFVAKLQLRKLKWVDGDYDVAGAYWGGGSGDNVYWATCGQNCEVFVRAKNREEAKDLVRDLLPKVTFFS